PGGSVKDRAALQMVQDAIASGKLKKGMTIIEGTAGNTGIGLSLVGASLGYDVEIVMPNNQSKDKERMIQLYGAKLNTVAPVPFKNENHFYHTAKNKAQAEPEKYWWADQFENLSNYKAHYLNTGVELLQQLDRIDYFVSTSGSGGTIAGISKRLKEANPETKVHLVDPYGSGLKHFFDHGEFKSYGDSFTEGIGIMRLVSNFKEAKVDKAIRLPDEVLVAIAYHVKKHDGIALGLSSALNLSAAFFTALESPKGSNVVSISCDLGERSSAKLYNPEFLKDKNISTAPKSLEEIAKMTLEFGNKTLED
ncbi:MAG: pyridoxal-phosphate dependent enzyme, partial [Bdellovibrionota bacterium]|nr:pyridoxal-phosphate dependent enzyme [Bdellovibrionota bacterium]